MKALLLCDNATWRRNESLPALRDGLERIGCLVEVRSGHDALQSPEPFAKSCDLVAAWNGRKGRIGHRLDQAHREYPHLKTLILERGFFQRMRYTQVDLAGFNHTASWAGTLCRPAPPEGAQRLFKVRGEKPACQQHRTTGYVLLLGQVEGDAQLRDCCVRRPQALYELVRQALPGGVDLRVRPHPLSSWSPPKGLLKGTLRRAVQEARFCVTLNSNAANEAIAWGCPVLALGPALCLRAGAAHPGQIASLSQDLDEMICGWRPTQQDTQRFLRHLACRQYNAAELREGSVLKRILGV